MGTFERYTEEAKRAIFFARIEAARRESSVISPAHLLLGLSGDNDSIPNRIVSLSDRLPDLCTRMGVPIQPIPIDRCDTKTDMPLTRDSKIALAYAVQEADSDGSSVIETDHLLRGLLRFPNEASEALNAVVIELEKVRAAAKRERSERSTLRTRLGRIPSSLWSVFRPPLIVLGIMSAAGLFLVLIIRLVNQ